MRALGSQTTAAIVDSSGLIGDWRGARCRTYPRRVIASCTWTRADVLTRTRPVSTRETVAAETPAAAATSVTVGSFWFSTGIRVSCGSACRSASATYWKMSTFDGCLSLHFVSCRVTSNYAIVNLVTWVGLGRTVLDRFTLTKALGHGGVSLVYEAVDLDRMLPVAVKVLAPAFATNTRTCQAARQEPIIMQRLRHPSVPKVYGFGDAQLGAFEDVLSFAGQRFGSDGAVAMPC